MFSTEFIAAAAAILAITSPLASAAPSQLAARNESGPSLTAQLKLADSAADRYNLLPNDEDFVFDFAKNPVPFANAKTFPPLVGTGAAFALGSLDPCTMSILHLHPRATEVFAVTSGRVSTEMFPEAGVLDADGKQRTIRTELGPGMLTVFPAGSFHTQLNVDCEPATIVAGFSSEDPGASLIADGFLSLSDEVVSTSFGQVIAGEDIDAVRDALPKGLGAKVDSCLAKCGIQKRRV